MGRLQNQCGWGRWAMPDCSVSLVIGLVKTQFFKAQLVWLGEDDSSQIKNAAIVKKGSEAILDNG